jgi:hypothetical protein
MKKHCDNCIYSKIVNAQDGWEFYACTLEHNKYVGEIEKCPIKEEDWDISMFRRLYNDDFIE